MHVGPDVVLYFREISLKVHLAILSVRVPALFDLLVYSSENKIWEHTVEISDQISEEGLKELLIYIYGENKANFRNISLLDLFLIHEFGQMYGLEGSLCISCSGAMFKRLDIANVQQFNAYAERFEHHECMKWCSTLINSNLIDSEKATAGDLKLLLLKTYNISTRPERKLCEDMKQLYQGGEFTDFILFLENEGTFFEVHAFVLAARSAFFRQMFLSGMNESVEGKCTLTDLKMNTEIFDKFLIFLYSDEFKFTKEEAEAVLEDIDFFQLDLAEDRFRKLYNELIVNK